jgi:muramoyltetrapeptide carboxypeptidase
VGYSDVTVLHGILNNWYLVETLHATMPINFPKDGKDDSSTTLLKQTLFGKSPIYKIEPDIHSRTGSGEGFVTGGNLSILYSLSGTDADIAADEKILFIEDLDEYLYHIDRMIMNLKHSGKLKNLAGLVVGSMSDMHDNTVPFGKTAYEIIREAVNEYDYPVCFGFPAGHSGENVPLIMGRKAKLEVTMKGATLQFLAPNCKL